ncbi:MAG: hypothetical protein WC378_20320 [Opitutaceae bacterium]
MTGMTAQEFLDGLGQSTTTKTLSNGLRVEIRRVDVMHIFTTSGALVPSYANDKAKAEVSKSPETAQKAVENFNQVLFASSVSPRFVPGTESNLEKNEIGIDSPMLSSGLKAELMAVVLEFNGFTGIAAEFFRLTRKGTVGRTGPSVSKVRKSTTRVPKKESVGTGVRRIRSKARHAS